MLKFQQRPTAEDIKIAANIERKRQLEEQRKLRIFNPRFRKIGVRIKRSILVPSLNPSLTLLIVSYFIPGDRYTLVSS
jgi:hypothetical protein